MNDNVIPIVVGADKECVLKSRELYGGKIHVFDERCGFLIKFLPYVCFHKTAGRKVDLVARYINDLAESDPELLPVVMFGESFSDVAPEITSGIESNCIIWREDLEL